MFRETLYSDLVTINAPREWVWSILVDIPHYEAWNPFTWRIDTSLEVGSKVDLYVRMPKRGDRMQTEYVTRVQKPERLAWGMKMGTRLLLQAERQQVIAELTPNSCQYQTWDAFSGLLTPLVIGLFRADIEGGFNAMARALKQRAESTWQQKPAMVIAAT